ncbi:MAG: tRNA pseudouridine(55) synthase TruB [Gammaproteobacteria bacterium]|nr:tRNA pseudouridine(55) synthase TruB [Gammaproteobacteria bacterium]MBU2058933.1 tRNA pseudouridine(55) synthase TruB [Gammaproteobacteria bacterium]MBU2175078.1 tRNA pseudouridine(55) synthase TruB [Gammaproteobacteria bacterium]MBU2246761.1 tRNA pseudouridine(55) synthase TruB [Gammaproteobacteria bacterium]MBU2345947.1 tRNA pseudouridine(55) synthase TruB [Gammaproteobacteria bacterium]
MARRAVHGILLLDKPLEISSNGILQRVRWLYQAEKAGHTGALDPLASGLLPICFGEATKFCQFLLDTDKTYLVTAHFGLRTDTSDAAGEIISRKPVTFDQAMLEQRMQQFRGPQMQIPTMFSALKYQGQPLYKYARQGIEVPREARPITIFRFELQQFDGEYASFLVHCSKGTYIRTLIDDLGEALGSGAYVSALRRIHVGPFDAAQMLTQEQLVPFNDKQDWDGLDALLLPMDLALTGLPELKLTEAQQKRLVHGQTVLLTESELADLGTEAADAIKLYGPEQQFIGVASLEAGVLSVRRLLNTSMWQTPAL